MLQLLQTKQSYLVLQDRDTGCLVAERGFSNKSAIATVKQTGRNPYEAVSFAPLKGKNPGKVIAQLNTLLNDSRDAGETKL